MISISSKATLRLNKGCTFKTTTSGGGGWESPYERAPERILWDMVEGLISKDRAESEYGVVLIEERGNLKIDYHKTGIIRKQKQKEALP